MVSGCDEQMAYNCFINLLLNSKYLLYGLYSDGLPLCMLYEDIIMQILKVKNNQVFQHIISLNVPNSFWLTKLLMSLFLYVYRLQNCLRIWDYFLARGIIGLLELILGLIHLLCDEILESDIESFGALFQQKVGNIDNRLMNDPEQIIFQARSTYRIKKKEIVTCTQNYL